MEIIIRISPNISETANDWATTKEQLMETCFSSLLAVGGYTVKKHFILDKCPEDWINFFKVYGEVYPVSFGNKRGTIDYMFDLARDKCTEEVILFLEDDYLWRNDIRIEKLEEAVKHFGAVTPYDHPDHYQLINKSFFLNVFNGEIFRNCVTTTHTFAIKRQIILDHWEDFHYGVHDWQMWTKLSTVGVPLWSPINSYATHMAKGHEALHYDWKKYYKLLVENNAIIAKGRKKNVK